MTEPDLTQPEEDPHEVAILLFRAMILPDGEVFKEFNVTKYTATDYTRMACHILFR